MKKIKGRERICLDRDCNMAWTRIQWMGDPERTAGHDGWVEVKEKQWSNMLATQSQGNVVAPTMALRRDQHHAGGL
jgi:hypothetical protein